MPKDERHDLHYQEFLSRGLSRQEAKRLADEVMARDTPGATVVPLKLSKEEAAKLEERERGREALRVGTDDVGDLPPEVRDGIMSHIGKLQLRGTGTVTPPEGDGA